MKQKYIYGLLAYFMLFNCLIYTFLGCGDSDINQENFKLPPGFKMELVSSDFVDAREIVFSTDGKRMWVSQTDEGKVILFRDTNNSGKFDNVEIYLEGLRDPEGLAYHDGFLYIAEPTRILISRDSNNDGKADLVRTFISNLPEGGLHKARVLRIGSDKRLYVGIGSSCNQCEEEDPRRAAIISFDLKGGDMRIFASGLRNPSGFDWQPSDGKMWCVEGSRTFFRADYPEDEINLVIQGKNYGWPYCFSSDKPDTEYEATLKKSFNVKPDLDGLSIDEYCKKTMDPKGVLFSKTNPKGAVFYKGKNFPKEYQGNLFIALHGERGVRFPKGFKVVRAVIDGDKVVKVEDFITGWYVSKSVYGSEGLMEVAGAPYGIAVSPSGILYFSDSIAGKIYRVVWSPEK